MDDLVQRTIEKGVDWEQSCSNCKLHIHTQYKKGFICSGLLKQPPKENSFDVIRLCICNADGDMSTQDFAPDEALGALSSMGVIVNKWLQESKAYSKFRSSGENGESERKDGFNGKGTDR